jgi:ATP-dependent Clp protease, protease subunit
MAFTMLTRPRVLAQGNDRIEIYIYEPIGPADWFSDGIAAADLVPFLGSLKNVDQIDVRLNSGGGDVFDGLAIYNALVRNPAQVNVFIDGMAWSIASVIAMAGDTVSIASNAQFMIHNPAAFTFAESNELRKLADTLDATKDSLIDAYQRHTSAGKQKLSDWMDAETWFTAAQTVDAGFADSLEKALPVAACVPRGMNIRNMPTWVKPKPPRPNYERNAAAVRTMQMQVLERAERAVNGR